MTSSTGAPAAVHLLMVLHNHQPVGNVSQVFERACERAYEPFLSALERHPGIRVTLHYSGPLLEWLAAHRPDVLDRVGALVERRQVELLASAYYEPMLPLIPEADRQGQIAMMQEALRDRFGVSADGFWLAERVWEPDLPATLSRAGLRYTIVDVNQFATSRPWLPRELQVDTGGAWDLLGAYRTTYAGADVVVMPGSKRLRYWLPFQPVDRIIGWLRRLPADRPVAITVADDGEKFGLWPNTHRWVYTEGWLDRFFDAIEHHGAWLKSATVSGYLARAGTDGSVWLPSGSYEEMAAWSGGHVRNFFVKYPEANAMYRKMLRTSEALRAIQERLRARVMPIEAIEIVGTRRWGPSWAMPPAGARPPDDLDDWVERARRHLYAAQCNCAYWHGVFGGLYLTHLRRAVYSNLLAAERLLDQAAAHLEEPTPAFNGSNGSGQAARRESLDADGDGRAEICLKSREMSLLIDPEEGGALTEWSVYGARLNLLDTLTRRPEPYHEVLRPRHTAPGLFRGGGMPPPFGGAARDAGFSWGAPRAQAPLRQRLLRAMVGGCRAAAARHLARAVDVNEAMARLHAVLGVKDPRVREALAYDDHRRLGALDYGFAAIPRPQELARGAWSQAPRWSPGPYQVEEVAAAPDEADGSCQVAMTRRLPGDGRLRKIVSLDSRRPRLTCTFEADADLAPVVAVEWNLAVRDEWSAREPGRHDRVRSFVLRDAATGVALRLALDPPAVVVHAPIEAASESEDGLELTYQGLCLVCCWALDPSAVPEQARFTMTWTVD